MTRHTGKVFGIGLSRTGTTSLAAALDVLGYRTKHCPLHVWDIDHHDASTDIGVAARFEFLDGVYPGSKFIYTVRGVEAWLASCQRWWTRPERREQTQDGAIVSCLEYERILYGGVGFNQDRFLDAYARHDEHVREWFADRPDDLLIMNICNGDGWEKLLPFLGFGDEVPFPCRNPS